MSKIKKAIPRSEVKTERWFVKYKLQLIISIFTFLLFSNSLFNDYNLDDELVTRNHRTTSKGISAIPEIFSSPYYQDDMGYAYEYRPVVHATFAIEHTFFGESPFVGHLINLLLYIALCLVLFKLLIQIGLATPLALFVTLLFSAHTTHTEVVCSIKNRDEILGLLFSLWSMLLAIKSVESKRWIGIVFSLVLFLLAMLSKGGYILFAILIPLAVVLFSTASLGIVMLFAFFMSLLGYFFLDIPNISTKNYYLIFVNLAVAIFYLWVRRVDLIGWAKAVFREVKSEQILPQDNLTERESATPYVISSVLVIAVLATKFFWLQAVYPSVFLVLLVLLAGLVGSYFKSKIWSLEIGLLSALSIVFCWFFATKFEEYRLSESLLGLFVLYISLKTRLKFNFSQLPYLTLMILLALLFGFYNTPNLGIPIFFLALFLNTKWKKQNILFAFLFFFQILTIVISLIVENDHRYSTLPILEIVFLFLFYFNSKISSIDFKYAWLSMTILIVLGVLLMFLYDPVPIPTVSFERINTTDLGNAVEALKTTKTDRPLSYIEYPLPPGTSLDVRLGTAFEVIGYYIQKTILPYPLAFYYGYQFIKPVPFSSPDALLGIIVLAFLSLAIVFFIRVHKQIAFGLIILLSSLAISSGFFMAVPGVIGDRYLFVASLGWSMLLGYLLFYLLHRLLKVKEISHLRDLSVSGKAVLIIPLLLYSVFTFARNFDWKDHLTLMRKDISYVSNSAQAHNLLALNIMKYASQPSISPPELAALTQEATTHFKKSFEIYPKTFNVAFDLGRVYAMEGKVDSAIYYYQLAVKLDATYNQLYLNIGELLYAQGRLLEAVPFYQKYIALTPTIYDGYGKLSFIYYQLKDYENSIATNKLAAEKLPNLPDPYINIGQLYMANQQNAEARYWLLKADSLTNGSNPNIKEMLLKTTPQ